MNRSNGEKPPVASSSKSHKLRIVILIERSCGTRRSTSSRAAPVSIKSTSFPPYGPMSFAFAMYGSLVHE